MAYENTRDTFPAKSSIPMVPPRPFHDRAERARDPGLDARLWVPLATLEESWVVDDRPGLTSAGMIEAKMTRMLRGSAVAVSDLRTRKLLSNR